MYSKEQRLEIGRQIYHGEISASQAAIKYDISLWTAKDYARLYRDENGLPPRKPGRSSPKRLKKGYEVKGDGSIILYSSKNTK